MRTIRMHSMEKQKEAEALKLKNNKVVPEDEAKTSELRRGSLMLSKESVSTVARAVTAISKMPIVQFILYGVAMFIVIFIVLMTPKYWMVDYGYYVPHWNYQGWGGPIYWKKLTNNDDGHMDVYNNLKTRRDEWTVADDHKYVEKTGLNAGGCALGRECVSYKMCYDGKFQSPININAVSWAVDAAKTKTQFRYSKDDKGVRIYKKLSDLFTPDANAQFYPYYIQEQLKFECTSESQSSPCGLFEWNSKQYKVDYVKLHSPAEHTFDNIKNGMEMQIVMKETSSATDASFVTLAVLFDVGVATSKSITELGKLFGQSRPDLETGHQTYENLRVAEVKNADIFHKQSGKKSTMQKTKAVNLANIVHGGSGFFHYKGSDTAPPCKEGIDWFIQADVVHMTEEQWQGIYDFFGYPGNARPTQDVELFPEERIVTYWGKGTPKSVTSLGVDW